MALTQSEINKLEQIFLHNYKFKAMPSGGLAEVWFNTIMDFMDYRGDEVISASLRESEEKCLKMPLAQEYISALRESVDFGLVHTDDFIKVVSLLTASPEERSLALAKIGVIKHARLK